MKHPELTKCRTSLLNLSIQQGEAIRMMAAYMRDLRDAGWIIEGEQVRTPMCMEGTIKLPPVL